MDERILTAVVLVNYFASADLQADESGGLPAMGGLQSQTSYEQPCY